MKRKFKLITIAVFLISVFALISCADSNDPVGTGSNGILQIEGNVPLNGSPEDIDVSESYIAVANGTGGIVLIKKNPFELADTYDYFEAIQDTTATDSTAANAAASLKDVEFVELIEEHDRLFAFQAYGTDQFQTYDISTGTLEPNTSAIGNSQGIKRIQSFPIDDTHYIYNNEDDLSLSRADFVTLKLRSGSYSRTYTKCVGVALDGTVSPTKDYSLDISPIDFTYHNGYYFAACGYAGVSALAMSNYYAFHDFGEGTFEFRSRVETPGEAYQTAFAHDKVYVADVHQGLQVIDVTFNDGAPVMTLREDLAYKTSSFARCVHANDDHLVVGSRGGGIYYFSLDNEGNPTFKEQLPKSAIGYVAEVFVDGNFVYVLSREYGVVKVSINN